MIRLIQLTIMEQNFGAALSRTRIHSPEQELSSVSESVQATMNRIYGSQNIETPTYNSFTDAPEDVQKQIVDDVVANHVENNLANTFTPDPVKFKKATEQVSSFSMSNLELSPDDDDARIATMLEMVGQIGVIGVLKAIDKTATYHLKDDLHRALVAYLKAGYPVRDLREDSPLYHGLTMTLFELNLPINNSEESKQKELKQLLSSMEQFYAGMSSVTGNTNTADYYSIEIAMPQGSQEILIYVAIPNDKIPVFKTQILAIFPNIKLSVATDDYNIFNNTEQTAASIGTSLKSDLLPLRYYDEFDYDPLNIILESFANLELMEGAAIQIMIGPDTLNLGERLVEASHELEDGDEPAAALVLKKSLFTKTAKSIGSFFGDEEKKEKEKVKRKERASSSDRKQLVELLQKKNQSRMFATNIRIVAAGNDQAHARSLLIGFESAFNQFGDPSSNMFQFEHVQRDSLREVIKQYTYRLFDESQVTYLNGRELTSIIHLHKKNEASADMLSAASSSTGGASVKTKANSQGTSQANLVSGKVLLGINKNQGDETPIYMNAEDRVRHMYVIGQTGTGKTSILKNMIIQDIQNGEGCCFIDPHGSDIEDIMANVPANRINDVIYFDPSDTQKPLGLNMLEYDQNYPEQKSFVVNEMFAIFDKLFDMKVGGGAMFEQYFRNSTQLVIDDPATGSTLLEISRVLSDENFRRLKLARCKNMIVKQFWEKIASQAGGEASLENIVPYITSKFDSFVGDDIMRPIIAQQNSAFSFRDVMDKRKILLINLSKGRLGEKNANLLGLIAVGKILMAALSRVDAPKDQRPPFYLYIDEFQNVTTDSISQILSEARKYGLSLNIAHQFIKQIDEGIRDAVFGNVGNMATFRVSAEDAEFLEKIHAPYFEARDISNIDNYNAYVKMLVNGQPQRSFSLSTIAPVDGDTIIRDQIKAYSRETYGADRERIEEMIMRKYASM